MSEENEWGGLQQVQYARNHSIKRSSRSISSDAPRSCTLNMLAHNHNILLNPILRQERSFGVRIAPDTLRRICLPSNNITSIKLSIDPAVLKHGLENDEEAEDNSEDNQEDTSPSISTNRHGDRLRKV